MYISARAFKRIFTCKIWLRYSRERAVQSLPHPAGSRSAVAVNAAVAAKLQMRQTLQGSFSAVSKRNFASKYAFESSRRDIHNALLCTVLKSFFSKIARFVFYSKFIAKFSATF